MGFHQKKQISKLGQKITIQYIQTKFLYIISIKILIVNTIFGILVYLAWIIKENNVGLSIFLINQVLFHMGEMLHVAFYKFNLIKWGSYLINHSFGYNLAISFSIQISILINILIGKIVNFYFNNQYLSIYLQSYSVSEYFAESYFFNKNHYTFILIGVLITLVGHTFRIGAFISAKQSFHHQVQSKKASDHILITTGIYSVSRHPSYFGFFIYSLGQQIVLQNPISFIAYIPVLYKFFIQRIYLEEYYLHQFFGRAYQEYSTNTPILIPFIEYFLRF